MKKRAKNRVLNITGQKWVDRFHEQPSLGKQVALMTLVWLGVAGCASRIIREDRFDRVALDPLPKTESPSMSPAAQDGILVGRGRQELWVYQRMLAEYHFSKAQEYSADGSTDDAIREYQLTLKSDPHSALIYARIAHEYVKKGMLSSAIEACKEALQRDPNFIDARLLLAGLYSSSQDSNAAVAEYDHVLKINPRHEEAAIYKAQVLIEDGNRDAAVMSLRNFVKKNSDSAVSYYYLGKAEQSLNHFKEAEIAYRKAMEIRNPFSQASLALGALYEEHKLNTQAMATYKDLYESSQDLVAANRLTTIFLKEEKYKQALPYLHAQVTADPEDMNAKVKLGLVQMELKQHDDAITTFNSIVEKTPDAERIHYYLGSIYEEQKRIDMAVAELRKIKPDSKIYAEAALHGAFLLKQNGKIDAVRSYIKECIEQSPKIANFYVFHASLEEENKNFSSAIKILETALEKIGGDERIHYYLGSLYDHEGETEKGIQHMQEILKMNPDNVEAMNYIGYTWSTQGVRIGEAEALLKRAVTLSPDNGYIQDSWGWHLYLRGRVAEAVVQLEKAVKLNPQESTILEHLADAYVQSNDPEKAMHWYRDAQKYAGSDQVKNKIQEKLDGLQTALAKKGAGQKEKAPLRMPAGKKH